ncbi:MAG: hypothetical protein H3C43_02360, partial [Leptonema sp. (in: Bacteria)]|nr:hypothetical protein [Leptonema sp. (in: bacteria)]
RSLLGIAAIALFSVGLGIVGFSYLNYTEPKTVKYQSPPAIESQEFDQAKFNESPTIKREIPLPTPTQKSKPESNEKLSASNQADNGWVNESTIANPEAQLLDQISAETNTEIRKSLQQKLLKLYESTGQTEKANRLRRNIKD